MHLKDKSRFTLSVILIITIITALTQYKNIIGYFYPVKYKSLILEYSREYNLDPYLVSSIINVESHYDKDAQSHKDAKGLMQITSPTGKWGAEKIGIENFEEDMLYNPAVNIRIGCWYLNTLRYEFKLEEVESDIVILLASYNGGSGNVRKWLGDKKYSQTGIILDQIPFKETKQYVDKVMRTYNIYKWLYPNF